MRIATIALCLLMVACQPVPVPDNAVAVVDGAPITADRFTREYIDYLGDTGVPDTEVRREAFLNRLVGVELVIAEARAQGLDRTPAFAEYREQARQKALLEAWLHEAVYDTIEVTESQLVDLFQRANTQLTARHLYANNLDEAQALYDRLQAGASFDELAEEVFTDRELAGSGGLVGTFGFDEMDPAFEDAAYGLEVGEISRPVRTSQGYSVIRVDDRSSNPILTETVFAQRRPALASFLQERRETLARNQVADQLQQEADLQVDADAAAELAAYFSGSGVTDAESDAGLVTFADGDSRQQWTIADFLSRAALLSEGQRARLSDAEGLDGVLRGLVVRELLLSRAARAGLDADPRVDAATEEALRDRLYEMHYEQLLAALPIPEDSVRQAYESAQPPPMLPERRRIAEIVVSSLPEAQAILNRLGQESFGALAGQFSERPETASRGGDAGLVTREALGPWADAVFAVEAGTVLGPLEAGGRYHLILAGPLEPARKATLDEARPALVEQIRHRNRRPYFRQVIQDLRDRYAVEAGPRSVVGLDLNEIPVSS